jgi:hypothetical protein
MVLSISPGPVGFRRLSIIIEPLEGILGGPILGFSAAFVGWLGGRFVRPDAFYIENFFGLAETCGAMGAGLLATRRWLPVMVVYGVFLSAFLASPLARVIPLWTLWDTYLGFLACIPTAILLRRAAPRNAMGRALVIIVALISFVAVELDAITRIFMLAVLDLYQVYGLPTSAWGPIFIAGAVQTPVEAAYTVGLMIAVGVPVLTALRKSRILDWPTS